MSDLNLLPSEAKFQAERMRLKALINNFLWVFCGVWLSAMVIILGMNLIFQLNLNQLNKKNQKVSDQYKSLAGNMAINQKVRYQAKVVAKVLDDRFEYGASMEMVKNMFSKKITIDDLEIREVKNFAILGSVANGVDMEEVEEKVVDINMGRVEGFKSCKLTGVQIDKTKGWSFNMEVVLL